MIKKRFRKKSFWVLSLLLFIQILVLNTVFLGTISGAVTPDPGIPGTLPTAQVRSQVCLNGIWNFVPDGGSQTTIQVPATWSRSTDSNRNTYRAFDYPSAWTGGTYSRSFSVPAAMNGKVVKVAFGSVRYNATVKVNNTQVGTNQDGFLPFEFKVNSQLNGSTNQLSVYVDPNNSAPYGLSGAYEQNRGIWQDVWLKAYPLVYVDNDFFVKTSFRNNEISCDIPVRNEDSVSRTFYIRNFVTDAGGNIVLTFDAGWQTLAANSNTIYSVSSPWSNPRLWWPHDPYLYNIHTVLYNPDKTTVVDWKQTRFGFKEFYILNGTQFWLNGRRAFLRGDGHHYQSEYQQTREYYTALFTALKEWGCNYFRPHTLPFDTVMLDVADEMGMMILDESAVYGSDGDADCTGYYPDHIQRWIKRDRNHPSVILWSFSNEVNWKCAELGVPNYLTQHAAVCATADSTRTAYAEGDNYSGNTVSSQHYFDFTHCGPGTSQALPIIDTNKVHIMGEYSNYMIQCFGQNGTGACGYETTSQDYGTGYWTHGETARDQTKVIQNESRYGGYLLWSTYWFANRSLPFFNNSTKYLSWPDLTAPGAKPQKVNPYMHTINWVDPDLPLYDPLPWFYQFACYYKEVRCSDLMSDSTQNNSNFYSGSTFTRNFNLSYESFADVNHLKLEIVRKSDGAVLYSNDLTTSPWNNIQAGTKLTNQNVSWVAPNVSAQTPVTINRSFYNGSQLSYKCSFDGNIYPRFNTSSLPGLSGKRAALLDTNGKTKTVLDSIGITYTQVSALSSVSYPAYDLLIIGDLSTTTGLDANFVKNGGRVLCLQQSSKPSLPVNLPAVVSGAQKDVQFLLNGAKHTIFDGLNQNDLSYWYNNANTANNVYDRPSTSENIRVLLAANNDGSYAPLLEVPAGSGTYLLSQMELINQYNNEPVAGKLLVNMLNYLGGYTPATKAKTGLLAASGAIKTYYDSLGLRYTSLDAANLPDLTPYTLLIVDGSSTSIVSSLNANKAKMDSFVNNGGKIMVCQINSSTINTYKQLISNYTLNLTTPAEKQRCVKCAVTWRHKNTTNDPVRYGYLNIPPPFEPNTDDLLVGLSNKDFDWTANQLNNAVKASGGYPNVNELIAPYRIDWANLTSDNSEFYSPVKRAKSRNDWFTNREPVLLKLKQGNGFWLINELLLENGGTTGKRIGNLLLTNLGASVGSTDTYYNLSYSIIPPAPMPTPTPTPSSTQPPATPTPTPAVIAFQQDSGADGILSMETEHFDANIVYTYPAQNGTMWSSVTSPTGYSGSGAMQAQNNIGNNYDPNYVGISPRLDFNVNFVKTGTHYVWILGNAQGSANDDTCHVGLDGVAIGTAAAISLNGGSGWKWTNVTKTAAVVTINISSAGIHILNLWDGKDGIIVDKIVLTTNFGYTPTGYGPAESSRSGSGTPTPTPAAGVLDNCDSTSGWGGSNALSIDTSDKKEGTGSLQSTGSGTDEFKKTFSTPVNSGVTVSNGYLQFWYYVADTTKFTTENQVELGSGGQADVNEYNWSLSGLVNGWNFINLKVSNAGTTGGTPNLNSINWFRLYHFKNGSVITKIDDIRFSTSGSTPTSTPAQSPTPTPTPTLLPTPTPTPSSSAAALDRTGWVGSGTGNGFNNAFDGNASTRWSTDALQVNGQYFQVDMQSARTFNMIRLDTSGSPGDYPRGYQVYVSSDGSNWGSAIASGSGSGAITDITFASQTKRYLKIVQTGSAPGNYWSIHEFNAYNTGAPVGRNISLKCVANNSYICSENGTTSMNCNRSSAGLWETFLVVDAGSGNIALKGCYNNVAANAYVCSENGGAAMICNRTSFGVWETFTWIVNGDGTISLRGSNGNYVTGSSPMWCNVAAIGSAEKFQVTVY